MRIYLSPILFIALPTFACLHFDRNYKSAIEEGKKVVFMFHDGKQAHMVLKTDVRVEKGKLPKRLAWVIPFPSMPTKYEEMDEAIFKELYSLLDDIPRVAGDVPGKSYGRANHGKILIHKKVEVGQYHIQPIEILDPNSGKDLDQWLKKNYFNGMPEQFQKIYLKQGAVFLAIESRPKTAEAHLKPLHVTYPSEKMSFPLKFTHDTRRFSMDLFVMTSEKIDPLETPSDFHFVGSVQINDERSSHLVKLGKLIPKKGYITQFAGTDFNSPGKMLAEMSQDPVFAP